MLQIVVPSMELWDEQNEIIVRTKEQTLRLEHSLISVSKWESKWHKPFLEEAEKTFEEMNDYIRCMTITQNVDPNVYNYLTRENRREINEYIDDKHTATTFREDKYQKKSRERITSELIYYWMVAYNIPFDCQTWHLNRLLTLIKICSVKNQPQKKRNAREIARDYAAINAERRKMWNTSG